MMRIAKATVLTLLLLLAALWPCMPASAEGESTTVMIYMCGSNLETQYGLASADIDEILGAGFDTAYTNVVMMLSGSKSWDMGYDPAQTHICEIGRRGLLELQTLDSLNMADSDTLAYFLKIHLIHLIT